MKEAEEIKEWAFNGRRCKVVKITYMTSGHQHYCGYVQTGLRLDYDDINPFIDVHGGLTYGIDEDGWIGFDCAHLFDMCVDEDGNIISSLTPKMEGDGKGIKHTPESVAEECEKLARQMDDIESFAEKIKKRKR